MSERWVRVDDLVGFTEAAQKLGVARNTLHHYSCGRHNAHRPFPEPLAILNGNRIFSMTEIAKWMEEWYAIRQPGHRTDRERSTGTVAYPEPTKGPVYKRPRRQQKPLPKEPTWLHEPVPPVLIRDTPPDPEEDIHPDFQALRCMKALCPYPRIPFSKFCEVHDSE